MFTDLRSWALAHLCPSLLLTARLEFKSVCNGNESMIKMRIFQGSLWAPWPFLYKYGIHSSQASCGEQNWFELFWIIFSTNWGGWGTFTLFGLGRKVSFNFDLNIGRSKKLHEGLIKQHSPLYYKRCIIHLQQFWDHLMFSKTRR